MLIHHDLKVTLLLLFAFVWLPTSSTAKTLYKSDSPRESSPSTAQTHYKHVIPVTSTNSSVKECTNRQYSLNRTNLSVPLSEAFKYKTSVQLQLSEGCFIVTSNELATFSEWTDFSIVGKGKQVSVITCAEGIGFTFSLSLRIVLRDVSIGNCARVQNSTSRDFNVSNSLSFIPFWVGMYFLSCGDITMDNVTVRDTNGVGVVMYNCNGTNTFNFSTFDGNFRKKDALARSGNVAIEFTYCQPGDVNCKDSAPPSFRVTRAIYTFYSCDFQYSSDPNFYRYNVPIVPYPHGIDHMAFGKGGGLSVIFKGRSSGNSITVDSCNFHDNSAQWGSGLYVSFADQSIDNKVTVAKSNMNYNICPCQGNSRDWLQSGGGAQIGFYYYPVDNDIWPGYQPNVLRNSVNFFQTDFADNMACWGGAVSVVVSRESPGHLVTNSVMFDSCKFFYNRASIATAVDISIFQPDLVTSDGSLMSPVFKDCQFFENGPTFGDATNFQVPSATGAVFANLVPLNFTGHNEFTQNEGTALVVSGTYLTLWDFSNTTFDTNTGRHGGAVAFIGNSWMVAHKNVQVTFVNNSAEILGGAIYSAHFSEHDLMYQPNCFFQYYKATVHPSKWNATFRFIDNCANSQPNSIYTTSLLPCIWPDASTRMLDSKINDTFCGHPWTFDTNAACRLEIATGPSDLNLSNLSITAIPGWETHLPVTALNDYGYKIQTVYTAAPRTVDDRRKIGVSSVSEYIVNNTVIVRGVVNSSSPGADLLLRTLDPKVISSQLKVQVQNCPPGYIPQECSDDSGMICNCICIPHNFFEVGCHNVSHYVRVYRYNCLTHLYEGNQATTLVSGRCPYHQDETTFKSFTDFTEDKICGGLNRQGTLCSKCKDGYGVSVNSYNFKCVECDPRYSWLLYILVELVPVIIFFAIVALFNISATSAPMNAFVFFSQMVTIPYFHNPHALTFGILMFNQTQTKILKAFIAFLYSFWNLDFFTADVIPGFCLDTSLTTLDVIGLKYLNAFLPILLIIICYVLIELHGRNYRLIRYMWRPFRSFLKKIYKKREPRTSVIDAFATFLLLSYSKIMYLSFSLFSPIHLNHSSGEMREHFYFYFDASQKMFSGRYAVLVIVAMVIFALFVVIPPIFFILYPTKWFQWTIDKLPFKIALRTFADAFNGDFRDGTYKDGGSGDSDCRRYAGYYFLFRVIIFAVFISESAWLTQYFIQQLLFSLGIVLFAVVRPYKVEVYNKLDTVFFFLLSIMNAFSFYNSQLYFFDDHISMPVFWINYLLTFLPLVYLIIYIVYLILLWKGCLKKSAKMESLASESVMVVNDTSSLQDNEFIDGYDTEEDVPDRLVNPQNYNSRNLYRPPDESAIAAGLRRPPREQERPPRKCSSEKSYFNRGQDPQLVPYGSFADAEHHTEPIVLLPSSLSKTSKSGTFSGGGTNTSEDLSTMNTRSSKRSSVRFQGVV